MLLGSISINFENSNLNLREKVILTDTRKMEFYLLLSNIVEESVILSTCNRTEVFFLYEDNNQISQVKECFLQFFHIKSFESFILVKEDCLTYLFELSCGLHSLIVGEDQISGQLIRAEEFARLNGQSKKQMNHIFRSVANASKEVKNQFKMNEHPLSLSYVAIQECNKIMSIQSKVALVIGSGTMASLAIQYLNDKEIKKIYIVNRHYENAKKMLESLSLQCETEILSFQNYKEIIPYTDILVSATSSPHILIYKKDVPQNKEYICIDLANPRDIDETVREYENVTLMDMDFIQTIVKKNQYVRSNMIKEIKVYLVKNIEECEHWLKTVKMDQTVNSLKNKVDSIAEETYEILNHKLTLSSREQYILKKTLKASMYRLIHDPILTLKNTENEIKQDEYQEILNELFHLEEQ